MSKMQLSAISTSVTHVAFYCTTQPHGRAACDGSIDVLLSDDAGLLRQGDKQSHLQAKTFLKAMKRPQVADLNVVLDGVHCPADLEHQALLFGWNAFFVVDLGLDIFHRVIGVHMQKDRLGDHESYAVFLLE